MKKKFQKTLILVFGRIFLIIIPIYSILFITGSSSIHPLLDFFFNLGNEEKSNSKIVGPLSAFGVPGLVSLLVIGIGGLFIGLACTIAALHRVREGIVI